MDDTSMMMQSGLRKQTRMSTINTTKQSAFMGRHAQKLQKMNTNNFWQDLTRMAVH